MTYVAQDVEGTWAWTDGEPVLPAHSYWKPGEPTESESTCSDQDYAYLSKDGWSAGWTAVHVSTFTGENGADGETEVPDKPGCFYTRRKFICSRPITSGE